MYPPEHTHVAIQNSPDNVSCHYIWPILRNSIPESIPSLSIHFSFIHRLIFLVFTISLSDSDDSWSADWDCLEFCDVLWFFWLRLRLLRARALLMVSKILTENRESCVNHDTRSYARQVCTHTNIGLCYLSAHRVILGQEVLLLLELLTWDRIEVNESRESCQKTVTNVTHFHTTFAENAREVVWKCVTFVTVFWPCVFLKPCR